MLIAERGGTLRIPFELFAPTLPQRTDPDEYPIGPRLQIVTAADPTIIVRDDVPYARRTDLGKYDFILEIPVEDRNFTDGSYVAHLTTASLNGFDLVDEHGAAPSVQFVIVNAASAPTGTVRPWCTPEILTEKWGLAWPNPEDKAAEIAAAQQQCENWMHRPLFMTVYELKEHRLPPDRAITRLDFGPIVQILAADGRYSYARRDRRGVNAINLDFAAVMANFGSPPAWVLIDPKKIDFKAETREIWLPTGFFLVNYTEIRVTYLAGLKFIPDKATLALAQTIAWIRVKGHSDMTRLSKGRVNITLGDSLVPDSAKIALDEWRLKARR